MAEQQMWTIGHWVCPEDVFLTTLRSASIDMLVDVRAQPGSRRSPQFSIETMPAWLGAAGVGYVHVPALTGRRPRQKDVPPDINAGWENRSFKNYADYTLTAGYETGLEQLTALGTEHRVAVMCGEPMPWRCHRSLIATTLTARGWAVWHLSTTSAPRRHELGAWGAQPHVDTDCVVTYPPSPAA